MVRNIKRNTIYILYTNYTKYRVKAVLTTVEEASTHESAKTYAGTVFLCLVTLPFDLLTIKLRCRPNGT